VVQLSCLCPQVKNKQGFTVTNHEVQFSIENTQTLISDVPQILLEEEQHKYEQLKPFNPPYTSHKVLP